MSPFFDSNSDRIRSLQEEAQLWVGTPFVAHSCVRGAGVDCVHLAAALYEKAAFLKPIEWPAYALDGGQHNPVSQLLTWLKSREDFRELTLKSEMGPGDLVCFRFGMSEHHCGVLLGYYRFIHARNRRTVEIASLKDPIYQRCLMTAYRPMEREA